MNKNSDSLSIVVPLYNEKDNVEPLIDSIRTAMSDYSAPWELIIVDDGSMDNTQKTVKSVLSKCGNNIKMVSLHRNYGQTAALQAGIDLAQYDILATLDGDLQNDPGDIVGLIDRLNKDDLDMIVGWRKDRKDKLLLRKVPSWIANFIIGRVTGVRLHDYGCGLKVYRATLIKNVRLYGEMHRFIPAWSTLSTSPYKIAEEVVTHHPRKFGKSKYGLSRIFRVLFDLLSVFFFMNFRAKPGYFFGTIGLGFGSLGSMILMYLSYVKFMLGEDIGTRPLLLVGVVFVISSIQLLTTGVLAEFLSRTYFESANVKSYVVREICEGGEGNEVSNDNEK
ncbi:MAG: glycosyltransferase family 2 protein [bacterium]|nr:glycosyltransferase family 2 protein [bacterium]